MNTVTQERRDSGLPLFSGPDGMAVGDVAREALGLDLMDRPRWGYWRIEEIEGSKYRATACAAPKIAPVAKNTTQTPATVASTPVRRSCACPDCGGRDALRCGCVS